ncbi:PP2C family serine/threonine-protein phosphatase [Spirosoma sp. 209]|uniref:PP2C family protein-serine/threonine phosphatase n=1 Tax=Spirosoma sp. 209 TaxID=1955701 RepID=UPI00098D434E|nr:protein phosphatase 2C domain-containing protein [Spirosoma sp. 209]
MIIQPALPLAFSQVGQRPVNQDALYPPVDMATPASQLFIVCDGMGGADKGEVASQLLCQALARYASARPELVFDSHHLSRALDDAYEAYNAYLQAHPLVSRMGSTLALVQLHEQGVTVAHLGDSRVYQFRDGKIIFCTQDHRQVTDMVEAGIITAAQARTHPWRNRLSRAVLAVASASAVDKPAARPAADVVVLTDVQPGDYFFMCTDGVLETLDDQMLETILAIDRSEREHIQSMQIMCAGQTKDNYSAYLIGIRQVAQPEPASSILS